MMEAICLGFCSEHATSLRALNLLLWIQPDRNSLGRKKKKIRLAVKAVLPIQGILSSFLKKADFTSFSSGP